MRMNCSDEISFGSQSRTLRPDDAGALYLDPICIGAMIDRSYAGYQNVSFVAPKPVEGSEMLVGEPIPAFLPELP